MPSHRRISGRIQTLQELRQILGGLKTTALVETHKLNRFGTSQSKVVESVQSALRELLFSYPMPLPEAEQEILVVIGSERGFCGDYNRELCRRLEQRPLSKRIAVGQRLHSKLSGEYLALDGAAVVEEVPHVLSSLAESLSAFPGADVWVLYQAPDEKGVVEKRILSPFEEATESPRHGFSPRLNLAPRELLAKLLEHYLLAALQEIFLLALLAENQRRLQHLEGAIHHLEDKEQGLKINLNRLRQEEITQELEVIMLNYESLT